MDEWDGCTESGAPNWTCPYNVNHPPYAWTSRSRRYGGMPDCQYRHINQIVCKVSKCARAEKAMKT